MGFKGVLFDLDGTLIDTSDLIIRSFQHTFHQHYGRTLTPKEVYAFFGKPLRDAMEFYGPDKVDELIRTYREFNLAHHDELTTGFTKVPETIQKLYNNGVRMAIVTSKTKGTAIRGLKLFDMDKYFFAVIGHEECQTHKPKPEPVLRALAAIKLEPTDCLMVGDSPFDLASARAAGTKTAAVRWTQVDWELLLAEQPDYELTTIEDLLTICEVENK
ncbi:pyrophosphatase PpaX [Sporomusa acidovorans]|uniref:Pyrophosphatase PpaX n=1 Tax=Sporomusa acidovorans (strain ATCC 49682 / DSM 3132 / Mol) TaxID=1123286 RepID=A0ABZ3J3A8_SPOA4|nr:pyrophosphatase PpaX [Sporomusa acidovorans]OZC20187.1 pyrophosphatase PpaX [Sporomusa acidovorans DSM 3132]SDD42580.1 pyrophosphatase PpaX [Sporomusa acidovorans]